jgi:hypothetical protein
MSSKPINKVLKEKVMDTDPVKRIKATLKSNDRMYGGSADVTPYQVACVLKALADHTLIMQMISHRPDESSPWPEATSVGRWMHDVSDQFFEEED